MLLLSLLVAGLGLSLHSNRASADGIELFPVQVCARDGKVNVLIAWQGADPGAKEFWVDLTKVSVSFDPNTYVSAGPIKAGSNSYLWSGLEPDTLHWIRFDQQLPSGDWVYGQPLRIVTACGTTAAAAGSTFTVVGFSDHAQANFGPPSDVVPAGGTLIACGSSTIYIFCQYTGLTDLTDFVGQWTVNGAPRPAFAWGLAAGDGKPLFSIRAPAGGFVPGNYTFNLSSGPANARQSNVDASFTLAC
jgi:hypothetical protein